MGYKFTEEQKDIQAMVRDFTKKEVEPRGREMDQNGWCHELYQKYIETGLQSTPIPEEYGGAGRRMRHHYPRIGEGGRRFCDGYGN